jgi:hypothetical protein
MPKNVSLPSGGQRQRFAWVLTIATLPSCVSGTPSSPDSGNVQGDAASEAEGVEADATGPRDGTAEAKDLCGTACPTSEPAVGDSCGFGGLCEYGESPLVQCNRVYECPSGYVMADLALADASACPAGLLPGCPASRTMIRPGELCATDPRQCVYQDGECDCIPGNGTPATWMCSDGEAGATGRCPVPRGRLGTPCSQTSATSFPCQNIAPCLFEGCGVCGNWQLSVVLCGMTPSLDGSLGN